MCVDMSRLVLRKVTGTYTGDGKLFAERITPGKSDRRSRGVPAAFFSFQLS